MSEETTQDEGFKPTDPGFGADASSEPEAETVEAEAKTEETEVVQESEAESPPAVEKDDDKKTDAFQERIDKLTASFRESERDNDGLRGQLDEANKKLAEIPEVAEPTKTLADFEYDEDKYRSYLLDEATTRAEKAAEKVVRGFQETSRVESVEEKFASREKEFSKTVGDYDTVARARDLVITQGMSVEIRESDLGPEMAYYLGNHPDEALSISRLSPREVIRDMAVLESKLRTAKESTTKGKTVSDAPPPPAKIKAAEPGFKPATTDPKSDKMSDDEWFKAEEKRLAKMRG